eukprot:snap_masked-scaffold269_size230758-processed-gene-1.6 protein:Tk08000 transcript:snap_masked-scaffold269_size230758-processed-gene-1.6-mRNA-1 annotation:"Reticulocalbin-2"
MATIRDSVASAWFGGRPRRRTTLWTLVVLLGGPCLGAVPKHSGHNHGQGERVGDGASGSSLHGTGDHAHERSFDHEAILGTHAEAEAFDALSPAEAQRRLRLLLTKMDRNGDERIEKPELLAWILRSFHSLSQEESSERFRDSDANSDGRVGWAEYMQEEFDIGPDEEGREEEGNLRNDPDRSDELQMMAEDQILFEAADRNGDGQLNPTEFLSFTHPEDNPAMHEVVVSRVLRDKDQDGDGTVDFQEYMGDRGRDQSKDWLLGEKDRFDSELDKNKDGVLSPPEIKAWLIPSNSEIAHDEVNHLFAGSDDDVDGILTFAEILAHHDLFVGSEATDYGEHLHQLHKFSDEL